MPRRTGLTLTCFAIPAATPNPSRDYQGPSAGPYCARHQRHGRPVPLLCRTIPETIEALHKAFSIDPDFWVAHIMRGRVYERSGDTEAQSGDSRRRITLVGREPDRFIAEGLNAGPERPPCRGGTNRSGLDRNQLKAICPAVHDCNRLRRIGRYRIRPPMVRERLRSPRRRYAVFADRSEVERFAIGPQIPGVTEALRFRRIEVAGLARVFMSRDCSGYASICLCPRTGPHRGSSLLARPGWSVERFPGPYRSRPLNRAARHLDVTRHRSSTGASFGWIADCTEVIHIT